MSETLKDYIAEKNAVEMIKDGGTETAHLIESSAKANNNSKQDYILNAEKGVIIAFKLNFTAKSGLELTKTISGKILSKDIKEEFFVVETRNGLQYVVPFEATLWVKTGKRWPRGIYEEMKAGAREISTEERYMNFGKLVIEEGE